MTPGTPVGPRLPAALDLVALFLVACHLVLRLAVSAEWAGWGDDLFIDALLWVAAAAACGARTLDGSGPFQRSAAFVPLAAFVLLAAISVAGASFHLAAVDAAAAFATYALLVALCGGAFARHRSSWVALLLASLIAISVYALLQRFWLFGLLEKFEIANLPEEMAVRIRSREIWSTFVYPNALAGFLVLALPVALGALLDSPHRPTQAILGFGLVAGALALFFTGALGAWVAAAAGAIIFVHRMAGRRTFLIVAAAALIGAVGLAPGFVRSPSMQARFTYWKAGLRIAGDHPVLGVGLNNFSEYYLQYRDAAPWETLKAHNDYLQVLAETGPLGLLALLGFLALVVRSSRKSRDPSPAPERPIRICLAAGTVVGIGTAALLKGVWLDFRLGVIVIVVSAMLLSWCGPLATFRITAGRFTDAGLLAGLAAGAVHLLVDFDLYEYGVGATFFLVAALVLRGSEKPLRPAVAGAAGAVVGAVALLALTFVIPGYLSADPLQRAGRAALDEGRLDEAGERLSRAARGNPSDPETPSLLGRLYFEAWASAPRDADPARLRELESLVFAHHDQALARRPRHAPYHHERGSHHEEVARRLLSRGVPDAARHLEAARDSYVRALELYPTRPGSNYALAKILDRLDRPDEALPYYRRSLELDALMDLERMRLEPGERLRALARTGAEEELVLRLRLLLPRTGAAEFLDQIPAGLGRDYDDRIREPLARAMEKVRVALPR